MSIRINISVDKIFVDKDWFVIIVIFIIVFPSQGVLSITLFPVFDFQLSLWRIHK